MSGHRRADAQQPNHALWPQRTGAGMVAGMVAKMVKSVQATEKMATMKSTGVHACAATCCSTGSRSWVISRSERFFPRVPIVDAMQLYNAYGNYCSHWPFVQKTEHRTRSCHDGAERRHGAGQFSGYFFFAGYGWMPCRQRHARVSACVGCSAVVWPMHGSVLFAPHSRACSALRKRMRRQHASACTAMSPPRESGT